MEQNEKVEMMALELNEKCEKTAKVLDGDYSNLRAGRANPHVLDKITVDYYGTQTPLNQIGNITVSDARCLVVAPWDVSMLKTIEKKLLEANIGITPTNDGKVIRLVFPQLTEERRKDLVKQVKSLAEEAKVAVRNIRRDNMEALKKMKADKTLSEDEFAKASEKVEKDISGYIEKIDKAAAQKEKDVMSV